MGEWLKLAAYRDRLFEAIRYELETDYGGGHKSYEGTLELFMPNYFVDGEKVDGWKMDLHCYVLGPSRHYEYIGKSLSDVVDQANADLDKWISEREAA